MKFSHCNRQQNSNRCRTATFDNSLTEYFLLVFSLIFFILISESSFADGLLKGEAAPDFELQTLDGEQVALSRFKGQRVLLKLGASWCQACQEQTREIEKIRSNLDNDNVAYIEVFMRDDTDSVKDYFAKIQVDELPVVLMDDGSVMDKYSVYLIPRILMIGPNGQIIFDRNILTGKDITGYLSQTKTSANSSGRY